MRKCITPIISVILLVMMTVVTASLSYLWVTGVQSSAQESVGSSLEGSGVTSCSRLSFISMRGDSAVVQNTGCDTITNVTILIDGVLTNYDLTAPLSPGNATTITYLPLAAATDHCLEGVTSNGATTLTCSSASRNTPEAGYTAGEPEGLTLTTFSDGSASRNITFNGAGYNDTVKIILPTTATVTSATVQLKGYGEPSIAYLESLSIRDTWGVAIDDINSDSDNEIVFAENDSYGETYLNVYYSNFSLIVSTPVTYAKGVAIGELNSSSSGKEIAVCSYLENKTEIFSSEGMSISNISVTYPNDVAIGELNSSSSGNEIVISDPYYDYPENFPTACEYTSNDTVLVFSSEGMNLFNISGFSCPLGVEVGELNNTSSGNEIIIADYGNNLVKIFSNTGTLLNSISIVSPTDVAIADINATSSGNELIVTHDDGTSGAGMDIYGSDLVLQLYIPRGEYPSYTLTHPWGVAVGNVTSATPGQEIVASINVNLYAGLHPDVVYGTQAYTTSPSMDIGSDNDNQWSYSGSFGTTETTSDFAAELNALLPTCNCDGCSLAGGNCYVEFNMSSQSIGAIQLSGLSIQYS